MRKPILLLAALLAVGGCAENFNARVSRYQALPDAPAGQTFVVDSRNPKLKGGLEFGQYAKLVSARLVENGYQPAAPGTTPDLVVNVDYSVDNGRERVESTPGFPGYGRYYGGFGYRPYIFGFYDPFLTGGFNDVRSYTIYSSALDVQIDRTADGKRVFEGTAKAV